MPKGDTHTREYSYTVLFASAPEGGFVASCHRIASFDAGWQDLLVGLPQNGPSFLTSGIVDSGTDLA